MEISQELRSRYLNPVKKKTSKRAELIKETYELYKEDKNSRKKENWKRYVQWLKENRLANTRESQSRFKKTILYIKEVPISSFCYLLSHLREPDFLIINSVARDKRARKENVSGYIGGHFNKIKQ